MKIRMIVNTVWTIMIKVITLWISTLATKVSNLALNLNKNSDGFWDRNCSDYDSL